MMLRHDRPPSVRARNLAALLAFPLAIAAPAAQGAPAATAAAAGPLRPVAYAVIVGTNRGGPGQGELRYAEQDARRVAEVLTDLGGYQGSRVELIEQPTRDRLVQALAAVGRKLQEHAARGEKSLFLFYYSGHARSSGLNLGRETLPLDDLREKLLALPSTVVLAVLDACQSGAFSRVKGAEPAADFSFNSVTQLSTAGIAVMASSGASELSQESDRLQSSFFTHHLLAALRGVADVDRDGHVTLAEAYRYAYHRTLIDTASTSVGSQHVTLETGLRGKGEVVLSYPAQASAQLELPVALRGELLVERRPSGSVIAELHKAAGEPIRLALAPGEYRALWRPEGDPGDVRACRLVLREGQVTSIDVAACTPTEEASVALKGPRAALSPWGVELALGLGAGDGYQATFANRGFLQLQEPDDKVTFELAVTRALHDNIDLRLHARRLHAQSYQRWFQSSENEEFFWSVYGAGLDLRAMARLWSGRLSLYLQGGAGLTLGRTSYRIALDQQLRETDQTRVGHTWFPGLHMSLANGAMLALGRRTAVIVQLRYTEVNDLGRYDPGVSQGGHVIDGTLGLRLAY